MKTVSTKKELAKAIKNGESKIQIEGKMAKHVKKVKSLGDTAWGIAFAAIVASVYSALSAPATAPISGPIPFTGSAVAGGAAATLLGVGAASFLVGLGIQSQGTGVISKLRSNYKIAEKTSSYIVLKKK